MRERKFRKEFNSRGGSLLYNVDTASHRGFKRRGRGAVEANRM